MPKKSNSSRDPAALGDRTLAELGLTDEAVGNIIHRLAKDNPNKNPFDLFEEQIDTFLPESQEIDIRSGEQDELPQELKSARLDPVTRSPATESHDPEARFSGTVDKGDLADKAFLVAQSKGQGNTIDREIRQRDDALGLNDSYEKLKAEDTKEEQKEQDIARAKKAVSEEKPLHQKALEAYDAFVPVAKDALKPLERDDDSILAKAQEMASSAGVSVGLGLLNEVNELHKSPVDYYIKHAKRGVGIGKQLAGSALDTIEGSGNLIADLLQAGENLINEQAGLELDLVTEKRFDFADSLVPEPEGGGETLIRGFGSFLIPYLAAMKATNWIGQVAGVAKWGNKLKMPQHLQNIGKIELDSFLATFATFDPNSKRFTDWLAANPDYQHLVIPYLQSQPDDTVWDSRLKNGIEGAVMGIASEFAFALFRVMRFVAFKNNVDNGNITHNPRETPPPPPTGRPPELKGNVVAQQDPGKPPVVDRAKMDEALEKAKAKLDPDNVTPINQKAFDIQDAEIAKLNKLVDESEAFIKAKDKKGFDAKAAEIDREYEAYLRKYDPEEHAKIYNEDGSIKVDADVVDIPKKEAAATVDADEVARRERLFKSFGIKEAEKKPGEVIDIKEKKIERLKAERDADFRALPEEGQDAFRARDKAHHVVPPEGIDDDWFTRVASDPNEEEILRGIDDLFEHAHKLEVEGKLDDEALNSLQTLKEGLEGLLHIERVVDNPRFRARKAPVNIIKDPIEWEKKPNLHPNDFKRAITKPKQDFLNENKLSKAQLVAVEKMSFDTLGGTKPPSKTAMKQIPKRTRQAMAKKGFVNSELDGLTPAGKTMLKGYNDRITGLIDKIPKRPFKKNDFTTTEGPGVVHIDAIDDGRQLITKGADGEPDPLLVAALQRQYGKNIDVGGIDAVGVNYSRIETREDATRISDLLGKGIDRKDLINVAKRGTISDGLLDKLAKITGESRSVVDKHIGETFNDQQKAGLVVALDHSLLVFEESMKKVHALGTIESKLAAKEASENTVNLIATLFSSRAETARAFRSQRRVNEALGGEEGLEYLRKMVEVEPLDNLDAYLGQFQRLARFQGVAGVNKFRKGIGMGVKKTDILYNLNQAHLLWDLGTMFINITSGIPQIGFEMLGRYAGATASKIRGTERKFAEGKLAFARGEISKSPVPQDYMTFSEANAAVIGAANGVLRGIRGFGKVLKTGKSSGKMGSSKIEQGWAGDKKIDLTDASLIDHGFHLIQQYSNTLVRPMIAGDELIKTVRKDMETYALAAREAQMTQQPEMYNKIVDDLVRNPPDRITQAAWSKAYEDRLIKIDVQGTYSAKRETFTLPLDGGWEAANKLLSLPVLRWMTPFRRTDLNMIKQRFSLIPGLQKTIPHVKAALDAGGAEADLIYGKMGVAASLATIAGAWSLQGNLTGRGPQNPEVRKLWEKKGWVQYGFRTGKDKEYFSYRRFLGPLSFLLEIPAGLTEVAAAGDMEWEDKWISGMMVMAQVINPQMLADYGSMLDAVSDGNDELIQKSMTNLVARLGIFTPGFVRDIRKEQDKTKRDPGPTRAQLESYNEQVSLMWNILNDQWPDLGLGEDAPAKIDFFGDPEGYRYGLGDEYNPIFNALSPSARGEFKQDPVVDEILRLKLIKYGNTGIDPEQHPGETELYLRKPSKILNIRTNAGEVPYKLASDEYYEYSRLVAGRSAEINGKEVDGRIIMFGKKRTLREALKAMMDSNYSYKNLFGNRLTDEVKRTEFRKIIRTYAEHGKMLWRSKHPELDRVIEQGIIDIERAKGVRAPERVIP